jgi:phosphoribosylaminoimidazolecarboxamide formyltransferase/IMP cyclohydrolase
VAYARARGTDRISSFGDWIALSETVDVQTAKLIGREVSDGVIAPKYDPKALEILRQKKGGNYAILKMDPDFEPENIEKRQVYGVTLAQPHDNRSIQIEGDFNKIMTQNKHLPDSAIRDMVIAWITLKFTQSNSVCFAVDGQTIGVGAGQQSRIHCTRLAGSKADLWWLRQHPDVLDIQFKKGLNRPQKDNAIDQFLSDDVTKNEKSDWQSIFDEIPRQLSEASKYDWIKELNNVTLGSDAFFPFRDSIDRAAQSGVKYVLQPGGSSRDDLVISACDQYNMSMVFSGVRLFHH